MRAAAAIIAAILSVFAGGPLRCPCQLAAVFESRPPTTRSHQTAPTDNEAVRCGCRHSSCQTQKESVGQAQPTEQQHAPQVPCEHRPGVDLVLPGGGGERASGERATGEVTAAPFECAHALSVPQPATQLPVPRHLTTSAPDRLRYCHSFRC